MNDAAINRGKIITRIIVCFIVLLVFSEILIRLYFLSPSRQIFDAELGWQYMPGTTIIHSKEGYARHQLNELGLNDSSIEGKVNERKVIVLGDSYTEALEVDRSENFVSQLDERFGNIDFINAGRGAYSPAHQLIVLSRLLETFKADQVLLVLSFGDSTDIIKTPKILQLDGAGNILSMRPESEKRFAAKDRFKVVLHNSALMTYLMRRYATDLRLLLKYIDEPRLIFSDNKQVSSPVDKELLFRQKLALFTYVFDEINKRAPLQIVYVPHIVYLADGQAGVSPYSAGEIDVISAAARQSGVAFNSLDKVFIDDYKYTGEPAFGFHNTRIGGEGHLNSYGHVIAAQLIAQFVKQGK